MCCHQDPAESNKKHPCGLTPQALRSTLELDPDPGGPQPFSSPVGVRSQDLHLLQPKQHIRADRLQKQAGKSRAGLGALARTALCLVLSGSTAEGLEGTLAAASEAERAPISTRGG